MKTWDDVMAVARGAGWSDDPMRLNVTGGIFHQAVTLVEMGQMTREEAMIHVALALGDTVQRQHDLIVDLRNMMIPSIIVPMKGGD